MSLKLYAIFFPFVIACGVTVEKNTSLTDDDTGTHEPADEEPVEEVPVDEDGDGFTSDVDCDDTDPSMPSDDADCDGVPTVDDCDDADASAMSFLDDYDCNGVENRTPEAVCQRWDTDRADLNEGQWSGSINSCSAGTISQNATDNALRQVNLFRWLSGLSEVSTTPTLNEKAQECALIMDAYNGLTHTPQPHFDCYSEAGAQAASSSNISPYPGVYSVELYMSDPGNETTLGHRRWIMSNGLGPIGLGSTADFSCMWVHGGNGTDAAGWTSWPPADIVPIAVTNLGWAALDETGWSLQSDAINLDDASVTITRDDGTDLPVTVTKLGAYYGSQWAISMIPLGWTSEPGWYEVNVDAEGGTIQYRVELVDCD